MSICGICNLPSKLIYESFDGYKVGLKYDIHYCNNCDASYANPLMVDNEIYNTIYSNVKIMPGYDRYYRYSNDVLKVKNPLYYLSQMEDTYWAIYNFLRQQAGSDHKILEVGCGLGYLTYALVKAEYDVIGIDISENAVSEATKKYGPYYAHKDIFEYAKEVEGKYDVIILTEVIEHVPNITEFILALKRLLSSKGSILITTPNKNEVISKEKYWNTELPPVHLWWLSTRSFEIIAKLLQMNVVFTDFTSFQQTQGHERPRSITWRSQTLAVNGDVLFRVPHNNVKYFLRRFLINYGLIKCWQIIKAKLGMRLQRDNLSISDRLCAILNNAND